jgi:hypothetical protein
MGLYKNGKFFEERVAEFAVIGTELEKHIESLRNDPKYQYASENPAQAPTGLMYFADCEIQPIYFKNGLAVYNLYHNDCLVYSEDLLKPENWTVYRYLDMDWNLPGNMERYCAEGYGPNWREPRLSYNWQRDANNKRNWAEL